MTREEVKENIIPMLQAYVDGNTIQVKDLDGEWRDLENPSFNGSMEDYRVKPTAKYRPFNSKEECWNEMLKHQPFGWMTDGDSNYNINALYDKDAYFDVYIGNTRFHFDEALNKFKFADGSIFGTREENV